MEQSPSFTELAKLELNKMLSQGMSTAAIRNIRDISDNPKTIELLDAVLSVHAAQDALAKIVKG